MKGGGSLCAAKDLRLVTANAGNQPQTTKETLATLVTPLQEDTQLEHGNDQAPTDWLATIPTDVENPGRRHMDVSQDPRYDILTTNSDAECVEAPARLPEWILPLET